VRENVRELESLQNQLEHAEAEGERLQEEGRKDYEDMRRFQAQYIAADQEVERLRAALKQIERGSWNHGNLVSGMTVMEFARSTLKGGGE
jgi:regulator of protease activity HflC (stomatin/prohibitin superfamily)